MSRELKLTADSFANIGTVYNFRGDCTNHDQITQDLVASTSSWYPENLTYLLSNLSSLFPSLSTLVVRFPQTVFDCGGTADLFHEPPWDPLDVDNIGSSLHILVKLLDLTFGAISQNRSELGIDKAESNSGGSGNPVVSIRHGVKHFTICDYPPLGCEALLSPNFRDFASELISFSLQMDEDYSIEGGGFDNEQVQQFMDQTIPECFLSHFYGETSLERLRLWLCPNASLGLGSVHI